MKLRFLVPIGSIVTATPCDYVINILSYLEHRTSPLFWVIFAQDQNPDLVAQKQYLLAWGFRTEEEAKKAWETGFEIDGYRYDLESAYKQLVDLLLEQRIAVTVN